MRSISWSCIAPESAATNSHFTQLPNLVRCAKGRSFGQEFKWLFLVHPFAHFKKWDGDRSTFLQKKWFVAVQGGDARSQVAFWNMTVTLCLRRQFLEGMIENEISLLGWLFGLLDGRIADG